MSSRPSTITRIWLGFEDAGSEQWERERYIEEKKTRRRKERSRFNGRATEKSSTARPIHRRQSGHRSIFVKAEAKGAKIRSRLVRVARDINWHRQRTKRWKDLRKRWREEALVAVETAVVLTEKKEEIRSQGRQGSGNTCYFAITVKVTDQAFPNQPSQLYIHNLHIISTWLDKKNYSPEKFN